ncbi:hypothetical protein C0995_004295 [Termitomyces sp. Mi166|nr:hypothetical protein C0995_004295 [Termitomyces sp. Mi166\
MPPKPLKTLKAGLASLKQQIKVRKDTLLQCINAKETVSEVDEHWLDNNANLVNEEKVLELLETASDYECGLQRLNSQQKTLVEKLKELGGGPDEPHKVVPQAQRKAPVPVFTQKENATLKQKIKILN